MITYDYYRIFYYVAQYKSFTKAARALHNNQPNITRCMNNLEQELKCTLFLRSNKGIALTPEGRQLYEHVALAFEQLTIGEEEIRQNGELEHGLVSIGASENALRLILLEKLELFREKLRNGTLEDCAGCPYTTCLHFGEQGGCFYGGVMVQEVYPAIREADAVVLLCPNYNDALSANLTAAINRLTALYRTTSFADKAVFAIVVSGYSGGDIVACQAAGAMNMNKGFWLPANFCLLETANDKGEALALPGIQDRADRFAENMLCQLAY